MSYVVIVCDLFHGHSPDHETVIEGFSTAEEAIEYARRRTRSSIEEMRQPGQSRQALRNQWRSFGEDCRVVGPEGVIYLASSELDDFLDHPATPEEQDWIGFYRKTVEDPANRSRQPLSPPEDFLLTFEWAEGTLPPPYHTEYRIRISANGEGEVTFWPDYPGPNIPIWRGSFRVAADQMARLWHILNETGALERTWLPQENPPLGGATARMTIVAGGRRVNIPALLPPPQAAALAPLYETIRALLPDPLWQQMHHHHQRYQADHSSQNEHEP